MPEELRPLAPKPPRDVLVIPMFDEPDREAGDELLDELEDELQPDEYERLLLEEEPEDVANGKAALWRYSFCGSPGRR